MPGNRAVSNFIYLIAFIAPFVGVANCSLGANKETGTRSCLVDGTFFQNYADFYLGLFKITMTIGSIDGFNILALIFVLPLALYVGAAVLIAERPLGRFFYMIAFIVPFPGMTNCSGYNSGNMGVTSCIIDGELFRAYADFFYTMIFYSSYAFGIPTIVYFLTVVLTVEGATLLRKSGKRLLNN